MSTNPFDDDTVAAVLAHMNDDHAEDSVRICRVFGPAPEATAAVMTGLDGTGGDFVVTEPGGQRSVRIEWSEPISQRAEIRAQVARLHAEAVEHLEAT